MAWRTVLRVFHPADSGTITEVLSFDVVFVFGLLFVACLRERVYNLGT